MSATGSRPTLYFGFAGGEDFTYKIGYTGYYYTDDFDDTYNEVNLGIGYGMFALDVAIGEWDGFGTPADYTFTSVTIVARRKARTTSSAASATTSTATTSSSATPTASKTTASICRAAVVTATTCTSAIARRRFETSRRMGAHVRHQEDHRYRRN